MKILFDENLSYRLVVRLADIFPGSEHARDLPARDDAGIWQYAKQQGLVIITKDADFNDLCLLQGFPPFVVWLRTGNSKLAIMEDALRRNSIRIRELVSRGEYGIIELNG